MQTVLDETGLDTLESYVNPRITNFIRKKVVEPDNLVHKLAFAHADPKMTKAGCKPMSTRQSWKMLLKKVDKDLVATKLTHADISESILRLHPITDITKDIAM